MELTHARRNKISLSDYDYETDIKNRILMSSFSKADLLVLEEILYSPLSFSINRLEKNTDHSKEDLLPILEKLSKTGLFQISKNQIIVDKEMRKYFEFQILKFEDDFIPDLEFLHGMLKKVPIHVLPTWYSIPRTSDNIFESLIEKYFLTPQTFQRYLLEINLGDPILSNIVQDVFNAPDLKILSKEIIKKYSLSKEKFEEAMLFLEFNLLCCLAYDSCKDSFEEVVTPFREWREYLLFIKDTKAASVTGTARLVRKRPADFAFVNDLASILKAASSQPLPLKEMASMCDGLDPKAEEYIGQLIEKLKLLKLADIASDTLYPLENTRDFLNMGTENQAIYIYRHPLNSITSIDLPDTLLNEKNMREAERAIKRVLDSGWVYFDEFLKGALIPLSEETKVKLIRRGKGWKYSFPDYSEEEITLIRTTIFEWLFQAGIVAIGEQNGLPCFCVTPFGQNLFGG